MDSTFFISSRMHIFDINVQFYPLIHFLQKILYSFLVLCLGYQSPGYLFFEALVPRVRVPVLMQGTNLFVKVVFRTYIGVHSRRNWGHLGHVPPKILQ